MSSINLPGLNCIFRHSHRDQPLPGKVWGLTTSDDGDYFLVQAATEGPKTNAGRFYWVDFTTVNVVDIPPTQET